MVANPISPMLHPIRKQASGVIQKKSSMLWKHIVKGKPSRQIISLYINLLKLINDENVVFCSTSAGKSLDKVLERLIEMEDLKY